MSRLYAVLTGRRSAWAVLALAVVASGLLLALRGTAPSDTDPTADLPSSAESTRVAQLQRELPSGQVNPAIVVYSREGRPLTDADEAAVAADRAALAPLALGGTIPPPEVAGDRRVALLAVPLSATTPGDEVVDAVDRIRAEVRTGLPAGLTAQVTGGAGFATDIAEAFEGADVSLLGATVVVVALLLLVTYRSPWLWLVPLAVIALADQVALAVVTILARTAGLPTNDAATGITSILVFGAGTNYALLLIARYREELRREPDRRAAMRRALTAATPAILASAVTVALSLSVLAVARLAFNRAVGLDGAVGIAVAVVFVLAVLPGALVVFGRGLFWPFVPRAGQPEPTRSGPWSRIGAAVARRPVAVIAVSLVVLAALATAGLGSRIGLSQTDQFRVQAESVDGQETLARYVGAGTAEPAAVLTTPARVEEVRRIAAGVPGVASTRPGEQAGDVAQVDVVLDAAPGTPASDATIRELRSRLDAVSPDALVGGAVAIDLDTRDAAGRDRRVIVPLVLLVVFTVLTVLLRALVAPVLLVASVVVSFLSAYGAGWLISDRLLGFPAFDLSVPLLSFLFLVALGVDYNIFLTTRAREEALTRGTRPGVLVALASTGGVITSAGVLLAAVFTVLGVLPVVLLTQIGVIVAVGVLLDTLLVRSVLVPALVILLGRRFWWPSALSRADAPAAAGDAAERHPVPSA